MLGIIIYIEYWGCMLRYAFWGFAMCLSTLQALPSGGEVVRGQADLLFSSNTVQVNANSKAILHWDQFNIASHEIVHFIQSQNGQAILNRVTSGFASEILGTLQANCPIYLINPNGVFIGGGAHIDTAGFIASTADLSNDAFWRGEELLFQGFGDGHIVNLGKINAREGDVFLIARKVVNEGSVAAPNGMAVFATREMMLNPDTKQCIFIRVDEPALEEGIENSGTIQALAVEFNTCSLYEKAIHHTGSIEALSAVEENNRIFLVAEEGGTWINGTILAESGEIHILGKTVALDEQTYIDASGPQGGTILIGGDYQGNNPAIMNSSELIVLEHATVLANSTEDGNGGKVIYWSDGVTCVAGRTEVKGGPQGGDGGFVEVSGLKRLMYSGVSDRRAEKGKPGDILFDPESTMSISLAGNSNITISLGTITPTNTTSIISTASLTAELGLGNVIISTNGAGAFPAGTGDLTFNAGFSWGSANTSLTCNIGRDAVFASGITISNSGTGKFTVNAARGIIFNNLTISNTATPGASFDAIEINGLMTNTAGGTYGVIQTGGTANFNSIDGNISFYGKAVPNAGATVTNGIRLFGASVQCTGAGNISFHGVSSSVVTNESDGIAMIFTTVSTVNGNINLLADFLATGGALNEGMFLQSSFACTGSGSITMQTIGVPGSICDQGIQVNGPLSTNTGSITLLSTSFSSGAGSPSGILSGGTVTSTSGNIVMDAQIDKDDALSFFAGVSTGGAGTIQLTGVTGGVGQLGGIGINILSPVITSASGNITINGSAQGTAAGNQGVVLNNSGSQITSTSGNINITGVGSPIGNGTCRGILLNTGTKITSTDGSITLNGTGGAGANNNQGILATGAGTQISSTNSAINLTGTGGGSGTAVDGISISSGAQVTAGGTGVVTLNGTASTTGTASNSGILVSGTSSAVTSASGNVNITAAGNGSGATNTGLSVISAGKISSTSGSISGTCTGGTGSSGCVGILVSASGSQITTAGGVGGINLTGTGSGTTTNNQGISLTAGGVITTTNNMTSTPITLVGTGSSTGTGSCEGIFITASGSTVSTVNGNIQMTGTAGGMTTNGILVDTNATVISSTSGLATLNSPNSRVTVQNNSSVRTTGASGPGINDISVTSNGLSILAGAAGSAFISTTNGNISVNSAGSVLLTGSTVLNSFAQMSVGNVANTITLQSIGLTLTAGTGSGAFAEIASLGGLINIDGTTTGAGNITLTGNNNANTYAQIITWMNSGTIQIGQLSNPGQVHPVNLSLEGGNSAVANAICRAVIATDAGGNITSTITGTYTITGGTGTVGPPNTVISNAGFYAGFANGLFTGSGNVNLTGAGYALTGGASGAGLNTAEILTGTAGGSVTLTSSGGTVNLQGGSGTTSNFANANIESKAVNGGVTLLGSGIVTLNGGSTANQHTYIRTTAASGANPISLTCSSLGLNGSMIGGATNASAEILSSFGLINVISNGAVALTGGSQTGTSARMAITAGDTTHTIDVEMGGLSLTGGTAASAPAEIVSLGGIISIDGTPSTTGAISFTAHTADAIVHTTTNVLTTNAILIGQKMGTIIPTTLTMLGGDAGTSCRAAVISEAGGHIRCAISSDYTITGGIGPTDSRAGFYTGLGGSSGNMILSGGNCSLTGGASGMGYNSAEVMTPVGGGSINLTLNNSLGLAGGGAPTSNARVITQGGNGITISALGGFSATGGSGNAAQATVATSAGGTIQATVAGNYVMTGGSSAMNGQAGFYAGSPLNAGNISLTGNGYSLTGGSMGAGDNSAEILTPASGGAITINSGINPIQLQGGAVATSDARIAALGTGNIMITGSGNLSATGGTGTSSVADVNTQGGALTVNLGSGSYTLAGNSGTSSFARLGADGAVNLTGSSYTLTAGNSGAIDGSNALIESRGMNGSVTLTGSAVTLNGGSAADQHSYIQTMMGTSPITLTCSSLNLNGSGSSNGSAEVKTVVGNVNATTSGNMNLIGGTATGANALIQCTTQGAITLNAQNLNVQGGSVMGPSGVLTQTGDINVTCSQNCQYTASTAGALAIMQTLGSDVTVTTGGSILLSGFAFYSTPDPGHLLLIAGGDINIGLNAQVIANGIAAGTSSLTLVVDNAFPTSPNVGPGQFVFDGTLTTGMPGTVELRIYTARRSQNTLTNATINGQMYTPGPFAVDTSTEMWELYYPSGAYGGMMTAFTIYYKEPQSIPPTPTPSPPAPSPQNIAANFTALLNLLPVLNSPAVPFRFPAYHFQLCNKTNDLDCDPSFSPYGSFIFEDDVYWIGTSF